MSSAGPISIDEVARMLDQRVASLAPELLPNGKREGHFWRVGSIEGEPGQSLAVNLDGPMQGMWTDFSADKGARDRSGDMLTLAALVLFGGDRRRAFAWARSMLGLDGLDPARLAQERAEASRRSETAQDQARKKAEWKRRKAQSLFFPPAVTIENTPVELYLASRGIDLSLLERNPRALLFHPEVWNSEANGTLPAMVARILDGAGQHMGAHRTWIAPNDDDHLWGKDRRLVDAKKVLGAFQGGYIPLWKGEHAVPLHRLPAGVPIAVSEGIEDGLTVACACPHLRVIAAISLSNIATIPLPPGPDGRPQNPVTIIAQNDPEGSPAAIALQKVVMKLVARGAQVAVARPPSGVKDANELATFARDDEHIAVVDGVATIEGQRRMNA